MGTSSWDHAAWGAYTTRTASKSTSEVFHRSGIVDALDPSKFDIRESRDSDAHPESTPIIVALDVTGSMHSVIDSMARKGLGVLVEEILERKPVPDPHTLIAAIGDARFDRSPLQATQFETDTVITDQIEQLWLEGGGGGNRTESYDLAWYLAAFKTSTDAYEKRGKKGYLFTVGDEMSPAGLTKEQIATICGGQPERDLAAEELLTAASRYYECFHVVVEEGNGVRHMGRDNVMNDWRELMGQRVLPLSDHTQLAEVVVSAIEISEGADSEVVAKSWAGGTELVVAHATKGLTTTTETASGVARL